MDFLSDQVDQYADLLISTGVNLQPGQPLQISAELEHAPFVRKIAAKAYDAGASYVQVVWMDALLQRARLKHSRADYLDIYPDFEIQKYRQFVDERWARLSLTGPEDPHAMDDVDAGAMRRAAKSRREGIRFYMDAIMSNRFQWCVAAVPTQAWAAQIYPDLAPDDAVARLWSVILDVCRVKTADPQAAWRTHDKALSRVVDFLHAANSHAPLRRSHARSRRQTLHQTLHRHDRAAGLDRGIVHHNPRHRLLRQYAHGGDLHDAPSPEGGWLGPDDKALLPLRAQGGRRILPL